MTGFDGPIVEYSWPSQGKLLSYAVDETNMYHDVRNFRLFLKALAERPWQGNRRRFAFRSARGW